ncbi:Uncharacterized protein QJS10_CPA08g00394 [Acorus calamus]|uniref:Uncharacterized protein n=1 Tax=Acorus calamus TaxID=4465 RepID=A0AAV9EGP0_ACOCL|nr:Uncharacterized protein QJS10_CPA08g00394 [Acorus calamus]
MTSRSHISAILFACLLLRIHRTDGQDDPTPWPDRFHAVLYMNSTTTGRLQITDLWYDWPAGRNVNLIQKQLGPRLHDVEWDNGTSYYYTLGDDGPTCETMYFGVGVPRPDFMAGEAKYLGRVHTDGFLCHLWEKLEFIWYYEDVITGRPVRWDFYDGITSHVMAFEVGPTLDRSEWQAPAYCFNGDSEGRRHRSHSKGEMLVYELRRRLSRLSYNS